MALGVVAPDVAILVVGAAVVAALGAIAVAPHRPLPSRSRFEELQRVRPGREPRPAELERLEREVWIATSSAFHEHHRLRRTVTTIARERLRERRGLELAEARELLGPELWKLVRPDRDLPDDRDARGVSPRELTAAVDALESI